MQPILCKNCEHTFQGNFCNHCGQKSKTTRLNWGYLKDEIEYTFLHINKGFLYSIKQIITRPGDTAREFIEGKRVHHYKPILMVFVLAGLNGFLTSFLKIDKEILSVAKVSSKNKEFQENFLKMYEWIFSHYALIELAFIPFLSLFSWIAFKKYGYNYIENIIINSFASSQRLIFGVITFPLMYFANPKYVMSISSILYIPILGLTTWFYLQLYKDKVIGNVILRLILFGFLMFIAFFITVILLTFLYLIHLKNTGKL